MARVFDCDGQITLETPVNNSVDINYFGLSCSFDPPEQILQKWGYTGGNGQQIKLLGTSGQGGSVTGFIDASSALLLSEGMNEMMDVVKNAVPALIMLDNSVSIANGLLVKVSFPTRWNHSSRFCASFVLVWEAP